MSSNLLINEPPLQVLPTLAKKIGLNEAMILQQIHYWLNPKLNNNIFKNRRWVRNTYEQWQKQFPFWSVMTIRRTVNKLGESGLLSSFTTKDMKKLKYYSINYAQLEKINSEEEKEVEDNVSELPENLALHSMGQVNPIDLFNMNTRSDQNEQVDLINLLEDSDENDAKVLENQAIHLSVQNEQDDVINMNTRSAQNEPIDLFKMNSLYKDTENTTENTIPPPLSPPPENSPEKQKEDEEGAIKIWNQVVQEKLSSGRIYLDDGRRSKVRRLLQEYFNNDLKGWREYCSQIANYKFLMGPNSSGFRVTFDWAVKSSNARKVLEGVIYDKPKVNKFQERDWSEFNDDLKQLDHPDWWLNASGLLVNQLGQATFKSWFWEVKPGQIRNDKIFLQVKNQFIKDTIMTRHRYALEQALKTAYPQMKGFELTIFDHDGQNRDGRDQNG